MIQRPAYHSFHPAPAVGPHQFPKHSTLLHSAPDLPLHSVPLPGSLVPPCPDTTLLPFHLANNHQVSADHHLLSEVFDNPTASIPPQKGYILLVLVPMAPDTSAWHPTHF